MLMLILLLGVNTISANAEEAYESTKTVMADIKVEGFYNESAELQIAKIAGYDSAASVQFWQKMASLGGGEVPEFLSTHPSDAKRIANLQKNLQQAKTVAQSMK